jgi:TolB-like protein/Tfp pilus assembly protein PilF
MSERYRIGDLMVDTSDGTVTRRQQSLALSPLSFDLLVALARHAPHVVRRQELLETVWPNEFVSDETLSQRVRLLRESLGEASGEPHYVASRRGWGYKLIAPVERLPDSRAGTIRRLAVLPLANLTGNPEHEYFADGMTEALISALAKIGALKVISRTSVMHYKHKDTRLPQIARELGVDAVIEGAMSFTAGRIRISVQLVHAATDEHLWAESYDRELGDVLSLHADLARAIAAEIRAVITPEEEQRLTSQRRVDPSAHEALLRGQYFFARLTPAAVDQAIAWCEQAISRDPSFAEAYAALAQVCTFRGVPFGTNCPAAEQRQFVNKAKAAAEQAIRLDESLGEAHGALGLAMLFHDWDSRGAERELDRALQLEPNSSYIHAYRALLATTKPDSATTLLELRSAIELDPVNLFVRVEAGEFCYWVRKYDQAIEYASQTLELEPSLTRAHFVLGRVFEAHGKIKTAIAEYRRAGMISAEDEKTARRVLQENGPTGYHRWALAVRLGGMGSRSAGDAGTNDRPFYLAKNYARLGEIDEAMKCLERAYEQREGLMILLNTLEWWDPLRSDPRFQDLVRRVGL